ncbi:hypothetical protein [Sphingosinicella terrae]|jgi:hypothetical protein|uniref:hypothetical protein n=1 Tax=Sphingosinicella terrae TaxID=2172047 RepID=UPI000E0D33BC|nr:hypothetical protein [Sphingosinicella terrae]
MAGIEHFVEVARRHSVAEMGGDLEGTLATLEADPIYELFPVGLKLCGTGKVRRYYSYFMENVLHNFVDATVHYESTDRPGHQKESTVWWRAADGSVRVTQLLTILVYGQEKLRGERLYADEAFLRFLFGPLWDEMEPHEALLPS